MLKSCALLTFTDPAQADSNHFTAVMHYFNSLKCCIQFWPRFALDFESVTLQNVIRRIKWACEEFPHPFIILYKSPGGVQQNKRRLLLQTHALLISSKHCPEERNK